jgi:hypothetical protein
MPLAVVAHRRLSVQQPAATPETGAPGYAGRMSSQRRMFIGVRPLIDPPLARLADRFIAAGFSAN